MHRIARFPGERLSILTAIGQVDRQNAVQSLEDLFDAGEMPSLGKCLIDASGVDRVDLIFQDMLYLRYLTESFVKKQGIDCKIAVVAVEDVPFGLARIYEQLLNASGTTQAYVSRNTAQALEWLGVENCDAVLTDQKQA